MKNLRIILCCVIMSVYCMQASAQQPSIPINEPDEKRPELFHMQPEKVPVQVPKIVSLLNASVGQPVVLNLDNFIFEGQVISAVTKYANAIQSVVVKSTNFPGATLTISRTTDETGNIKYTGRIISMKHGDVYQLKQVGNGLALVKEKYNRVVVE